MLHVCVVRRGEEEVGKKVGQKFLQVPYIKFVSGQSIHSYKPPTASSACTKRNLLVVIFCYLHHLSELLRL